MRYNEFYWGLVYGGAAGLMFSVCATVFIVGRELGEPTAPGSFSALGPVVAVLICLVTLIPSVTVSVIIGGLIGALIGKRKETNSGEKTPN